MVIVYPLWGYFYGWQIQVCSAEMLSKSRNAFVRLELLGRVKMNARGLHFKGETRGAGGSDAAGLRWRLSVVQRTSRCCMWQGGWRRKTGMAWERVRQGSNASNPHWKNKQSFCMSSKAMWMRRSGLAVFGGMAAIWVLRTKLKQVLQVRRSCRAAQRKPACTLLATDSCY